MLFRRSGGTQLTVDGANLDSVHAPRLQLYDPQLKLHYNTSVSPHRCSLIQCVLSVVSSVYRFMNVVKDASRLMAVHCCVCAVQACRIASTSSHRLVCSLPPCWMNATYRPTDTQPITVLISFLMDGVRSSDTITRYSAKKNFVAC